MQRIVRKQTVLNVVDVSGSMLEPAGAGTRIDLAVKAIYDSMAQLPDDARAGLWVFSSDRGNDDPTGGLSEKSLITKLKAAQDDKRPVRLALIGMGPSTDVQTMRRVTGAIGGLTAVAANPADITGVFASAMWTVAKQPQK